MACTSELWKDGIALGGYFKLLQWRHLRLPLKETNTVRLDSFELLEPSALVISVTASDTYSSPLTTKGIQGG